ncbi:GntR family transcriptional regulator [Kitasatospora sp. NBC_00240]|uniref:LacI family DNA-binding transcriptional regulator n=1 Tax=Kitasatospora sp. NBC_00240 TaxID=2903567 RepID=UPI002253508B|nr:GntR family transcriptional regulator [Kitasatospora sp. NBC_00240]MCX5208437.1 GntR family transcriptional regulator [Kitasatospora sp. NBC_00240]
MVEGPAELKFLALADRLRREILDGIRQPGTRLPTEKELAADTAVSISTVRRAVDNLVAEGLVDRRQGSGTYVRTPQVTKARRLLMGVVVPSTTFYYPHVLRGIEEVRAEADARVELVCSGYDQRLECKLLHEMLDAGVDGLLLTPTLTGPEPTDTYLSRLAQLPVPAVLIERRDTSLRAANDSVCTHHEAGAYEAVGHLAQLGHRTIGLVLRSPSPTADPVAAGYRQAIAELGAVPIRFQASLEEWGPATADRALAHLRSAGCTAALCFGDRQAALLVSAARRADLSVPGDLALVAYDDEIADIPDVPLTAVAPPKYLVGRTAAELLLHRLRHPDHPPRSILLRPGLTIRQSCGAVVPAER